MTPNSELLADLLQTNRLTAVVDIGANPITDIPPYQAMLGKRLCSLVGFEPQAEGLATLNERKSDLETYLPYPVGDGTLATLKVCHAPGMSSLLTPNPQILDCLALYSIFGMVTGELPMQTHSLDNISEIAALDFLKIDVQGSELAVFRGGRAHLANAVAVHTEVCFMQLYKDQPLFGDIDRELRSLGMIPHMFTEIKKAMILPLYFEKDLYATMNQALYTDVVYVRDFTRPDDMSAEQLKHLALISHYCYQSYDLTVKCLRDLQLRNAIASDSMTRYLTDFRRAA
jgi:FkbM family methyltransferase